jgi:hypothetical protein
MLIATVLAESICHLCEIPKAFLFTNEQRRIQMFYRFNFDGGKNAVVDCENDNAIEYDDLDRHAGELVAHILNDNARLYKSLDSLRVELQEKERTIKRLSAPTSEQINELICALGETFLDYEHRAAVRKWVAALATPTP